MNKFVLLLGLLLFSCSAVSAYQINIDAPDTVSVGKPLVVTGSTNFGIGTPIDVVLYHQVTTSTEVKRTIAYVQSDHSFRVVFDTTNLEKGTYKVEVPASGLGESINARIVELVERSDEITLLSTEQEYNGVLRISGTLQGNKNTGVQIEVTDPDGRRVFGPEYIGTNSQGAFAADVPISGSGGYEVSFTDSDGYIGTKTITVTGAATAAAVTETTVGSWHSAKATASRDQPAYFIVKAGSGPVTIRTSTGVDWVLEYIDEDGEIRSVNDHGKLNPEEIEIDSGETTIPVRVYAFGDIRSTEVVLSAANANSVSVSATPLSGFADPDGGSGSSGETQAPLSPAAAGLALLVVAVFCRLRR